MKLQLIIQIYPINSWAKHYCKSVFFLFFLSRGQIWKKFTSLMFKFFYPPNYYHYSCTKVEIVLEERWVAFLSPSKNSENSNFRIFLWVIRTQPISLVKLFLLYQQFFQRVNLKMSKNLIYLQLLCVCLSTLEILPSHTKQKTNSQKELPLLTLVFNNST